MFSDEINLFEAYIKDSIDSDRQNKILRNNTYQKFKDNLCKLFESILTDNISQEQIKSEINLLKIQLDNYDRLLSYQ